MTRMTISWEGAEAVPGIIIQPGALRWEDEELPLCWNFDHNELLGQASEIRREDDGRITAEITIYEQTDNQKHAQAIVDHGDTPATVYVTDLTEKREDDKRIVESGRIRSVNLVPPGNVSWS